ncbi:SH3 and multiple ankyrin repeat domains protein 1 [Lonchura striata]|uniref:SH3 and multiple ankyrin repeat domains protein 1 n=1 Tax=Lonchura striata TaxID=40157 RepID=A0A218U9B9_9PASE|nr:SH3 and multiple ankyrin repeat domains protein 1 [Lonchura striata domestica]
MPRSPASSEEEEGGRGSEYPEPDSDSGSSREGPPGPGRAPRPPPEEAQFSMMVFRIGIPDLHQTFRYKTRVYKQTNLDEKQLAKLHTKALLDLGGSPNYKDRRGLTPLYHTAMVGGDPRCCELLLYNRAHIGTADENGWQEIHQVTAVSPCHRVTVSLCH